MLPATPPPSDPVSVHTRQVPSEPLQWECPQNRLDTRYTGAFQILHEAAVAQTRQMAAWGSSQHSPRPGNSTTETSVGWVLSQQVLRPGVGGWNIHHLSRLVHGNITSRQWAPIMMTITDCSTHSPRGLLHGGPRPRSPDQARVLYIMMMLAHSTGRPPLPSIHHSSQVRGQAHTDMHGRTPPAPWLKGAAPRWLPGPGHRSPYRQAARLQGHPDSPSSSPPPQGLPPTHNSHHKYQATRTEQAGVGPLAFFFFFALFDFSAYLHRPQRKEGGASRAHLIH